MTEEELDFLIELARWETSSVCDIFSVLEGFRPVGLLGINNYTLLGDDFFENSERTREDWPSNNVRISKFIKILGKYYTDYRVCNAWGEDVYFLYHKDSQKDVEEFLSRDQVWSLEWETGLGLLFNYPSCCIEKHCNKDPDSRVSEKTKEIMKKNPRRIIPFGRCSLDCGQDWIDEYARIVKKYDLDMKNKCLAEDFIIYD